MNPTPVATTNPTPVTAGATPRPLAPKSSTRARRQGRGPIFTGLSLTFDKFAAGIKVLTDGAQTAIGTLTPLVPSAFLRGKVVNVPAGYSNDFVLGMAGIQDEFAADLGKVPTDTTAMRDNLTLADAAESACGPLQTVQTVLDNVASYARSQAMDDARTIYKYASVAALHNPALAQALERFRAARARNAKKGVVSRAKNTQARSSATGTDAGSASAATAIPSSTTTVTTSQR